MESTDAALVVLIESFPPKMNEMNPDGIIDRFAAPRGPAAWTLRQPAGDRAR
jgi:hypothetical protein